jgi:acetoin utilization protein AcuB
MNKKFTVDFIAQVMTPVPKTVGPDLPLIKAQEFMSRYKIRHLPVMVGNRVVGIVSERNVKAASLSKWGEGFEVKDVMMPNPYVIRPTASLDNVLGQMIKCKYGSVIIQEKKGNIVGIFTTVDALGLLRKLLKVNKKTKQ